VIRRVTGTILLGALSYTATALSQGPARDTRLQERLNGKLREAVTAIVDSASRANLPTEPLIQKALEGAAKGASDGTIIAAVSRMSQDLQRARRALGPGFSSDDVKAAMHAIKAGVDIKQLERLRAARSGQRIATAIDVIVYLGALRVDPDTAANVIVGLVLAQATDDQLLALKDDIVRDLAAGTPAASAMTVRGQELSSLIAASQADNGGLPGSSLPSGLGSTRPADPGANAALGGGAAGNAAPGGAKPAPAGKAGTPKKP
jgi:hypothetical protein